MLSCDTTHFGCLEYDSAATIDFGEGLPGFEYERRFVVVQQPVNHPLVFLQSLQSAGLCFPALPVRVVEPATRHRSPRPISNCLASFRSRHSERMP